MDIHPIIVHVPVAFLAIYSLAELFTYNRLKTSNTWFWIKSFLLTIGFIFTEIALATGENASELKRGTINRSLVHMHAGFAEATAVIFGTLIVFYATVIIFREAEIQKFFIRVAGKIHRKLPEFISFIARTGAFLAGKQWILSLVAFSGLVVVLMTGLLGGALVYGTSADPFAGFVLKLLGL